MRPRPNLNAIMMPGPLNRSRRLHSGAVQTESQENSHFGGATWALDGICRHSHLPLADAERVRGTGRRKPGQ